MVKALITLYNPNEKVKDNVLTIADQVDWVYLCDNSKESNEFLFSNIKNITYIFNKANLALSGAFNKALKNEDFNWNDDDYVFFFDQDSHIEKKHIIGLINEFEFLINKGFNIGCLGPIYYNRSFNKLAIPKSKKRISENSYIVKSIITSSLVCQYKDIKEINFWNEEVFLDMADWDLCWRFIQNNKLCVETESVILNHAVGTGVKRVGVINIPETNAIREYYQTRNYLYFLKKKYTPIKYKLKFIRNLIVRPVLHYFFLNDGKERIKYIKAGFCDYKQKYFGEYRGK